MKQDKPINKDADLYPPRVIRSLRIQEDLWEMVKERAHNDRRTISSTVEIAFEQYLEAV